MEKVWKMMYGPKGRFYMDKRKVILDCDTGSDDAVAIMLAVLSEKIDLLGITTVAGNKKLEFTTFNTLAVLDAL